MKLLSSRKTVLIFLLLVLSSLALGAWAESKLRQQNTDIYHDLEIFAKIVEKVKSYYVDEVDTHELVQDAIQEMLHQLDPHSQYLSGLEYEDLVMSTRGEFGGLGIFISFRDNFPTVISPIDDTPADRAGLRGGDQIIEIEGMATDGWRVNKAVGYLRGEPGSMANFKVSRPGLDEAIDYAITREVINVKSVPFYGMFNNDVGYIKVSSFAKRTRDELEDALDQLEQEGLRGLVLDFRSNPGGLLQAATEVSELFLNKDKLVVYTKGRLANSNRKYYSSNARVHDKYPIVVMINGASASASEIFAGALQDWDAGFVVGQTSFGKGTVQTVFNLSDTEAVKLTTAKYYTPSGRSIHRDPEKKGAVMAVTADRGDSGTVDENDEKADARTANEDEDAPIFYTSSGRIVYGGGGIAPDLKFEALLYTDLQRRLERDGAFFAFGVNYATDHEITEDFVATDELYQRFLRFLDEREFEYEDADLTEDNEKYIRIMIARDLVAAKFGRRAIYPILLSADTEFQEVLRIMEKAPTLDEMFKYAEEQKSIKKASVE